MSGEAGQLVARTPPTTWLTGSETLFCLAARFHVLSGNPSDVQTARQLFGRPTGGHPPELPGGIETFAARFGGALGSAREILLERTCAPMFVATRTAGAREALLRALEVGTIGPLKSRIGLLASGFGATARLKACRECMSEDEQRHGTAIWHLEHQLPGAWLCLSHQQILLEVIAGHSYRARYRWLLPRSSALVPVIEGRACHALTDALARIAAAAHGLHAFGKGAVIDPYLAAKAIRSRLHELGLASPNGRLRQHDVGSSFCNFAKDFRRIPELSSVATSPRAAYSQLNRVLCRYGDGVHPLRLSSVISWLFPTFDEFIRGCETSAVERQHAQPLGTPLERDRTSRLLDLTAAGCSVSAAARKIGVSAHTAQTWLTQAGLEVAHRASPRRLSIIKALQTGAEKSVIAQAHMISQSTVERVLRTEVGLHEAWRAARLNQMVHENRSKWQKGLTNFGSAKLARQQHTATYYWLYRNDKNWLLATNKMYDSPPPTVGARVRWDARDRHFSNAVKLASARFSERGQRLQLNDLLECVPELKAKIRTLARLPLTMRAIDAALAAPREAPAHLTALDLRVEQAERITRSARTGQLGKL